MLLGLSHHKHAVQLRGVQRKPTRPSNLVVMASTQDLFSCLSLITVAFPPKTIAGRVGSDAAEVRVKFQRNWQSLDPNLTASRLHGILR